MVVTASNAIISLAPSPLVASRLFFSIVFVSSLSPLRSLPPFASSFSSRSEQRRTRMAEGSKGGAAGAAATCAAAGPPPTSPKIVLKSIDMNDKMWNDTTDCARTAFEKYKVEKEIAEYIKKEFDKKYGQTWHCIVGRDFGSYVTHETNHFVYFYVDKKAVLLFKSG